MLSATPQSQTLALFHNRYHHRRIQHTVSFVRLWWINPCSRSTNLHQRALKNIKALHRQPVKGFVYLASIRFYSQQDRLSYCLLRCDVSRILGEVAVDDNLTLWNGEHQAIGAEGKHLVRECDSASCALDIM